MLKKTEEAEANLHDQTQLLPKAELIRVFCIMSLAMLVCFIDQNGIGVLLPTIAKDLNAESTISWAGTSALIANTIFQVIYGRLSDLFGRKNVFLSACILLAVSDLCCGLSVNATMLYIFRGLSGVANAGITSLAMMLVSDVVTLRERGKFQGIFSLMVSLGSAVGSLIAAGFATNSTWRGLFYFLAPTVTLIAAAIWRYLPSNMPTVDLKETVAKIDILGMILGTASLILLLIPISNGGEAGIPWDSPMVIAMFCVGGACLLGFLWVEGFHATLPLMPLSMFRSVSVSAMLAQCFLLGACYSSYIYFLPLYFQNVRGESPLIAACLQLPMYVAHCISSVSGGQYTSRFNRYAEVIWLGFGTWTLGSGLLILAGESTSYGAIAVFLILIGVGTGLTFQPILVAMQAHCPKAQRAVATSNRNFLRSSGGAVGSAVSTAVLGNVLKLSLPAELQSVANSTFATPDLSGFSDSDRVAIKQAYTDASRAVFIWCAPLLGICFLLTALIKDRGLEREEEKEARSDTALHGEPELLSRVNSEPEFSHHDAQATDGQEKQSERANVEAHGNSSICSEKGSKASSVC